MRWRERETAPDGTVRRALRDETLGTVSRKDAGDITRRSSAGSGAGSGAGVPNQHLHGRCPWCERSRFASRSRRCRSSSSFLFRSAASSSALRLMRQACAPAMASRNVSSAKTITAAATSRSCRSRARRACPARRTRPRRRSRRGRDRKARTSSQGSASARTVRARTFRVG